MNYPPLTAEYCLHIAINASPYPSRFKDDDDPSVKTLFDLGVSTPTDGAMYAQAVKSRIFPWHIDSSAVASAPGTTMQAAADSIQIGAFKG